MLIWSNKVLFQGGSAYRALDHNRVSLNDIKYCFLHF